MRLEFLLALGFYFVLLLLSAFLLSRKNRNLEDYFLASRKLPGRLVYFSVTASWLGATSTLVAIDQSFSRGISSIWIMGMPAVVTVLIFAVFLSRPIRNLPIFSLPDLAEMKYSAAVRHIMAGFIVWYMVLLAASQMVAMGKFLQSFLEMGYIPCLLIGTAAVLAYSVVGGFFSVTVTDGMQLILLLVGTAAVFFHLSGKISGPVFSELFRNEAAAGRLALFRDPGFELLVFLSFTLAWIISPITWQRIQSAKSIKSARTGLFGASGTLLGFYIMAAGIGILAIPLLPQTGTGEPLISRLITAEMGSILGALMFVAIAAAVMSTMDTALNTGALSLTWDIFNRIFRFRRSGSVAAARIATIIVAAAALSVAARFQSILKTLGLASEIMAEGLFIPGMAMLFLRRRMPAAGMLSLLAGGLYAIIGFLCQSGILFWKWPDWPYSVPVGLALSGAGFLIGAVIDGRR